MSACLHARPPNIWSCTSQIASFLHFNGSCNAVLGHRYSVDLTRTTLFLSQNSSSAIPIKHLRYAGKHITAIIYRFSWMRPGAYPRVVHLKDTSLG
jgi:hypothetical protein